MINSTDYTDLRAYFPENQEEYTHRLNFLSSSHKHWRVHEGKIEEINFLVFLFEKIKGLFLGTDQTQKALLEFHVIKFLEAGYHHDFLNNQTEKIQNITLKMGWSKEVDLPELFASIKSPLEQKIDFAIERIQLLIKKENNCSKGSVQYLFKKYQEKSEWGIISKEHGEIIDQMLTTWQTGWDPITPSIEEIFNKKAYSEEYLKEILDLYDKLIKIHEIFFESFKTTVKSSNIKILESLAQLKMATILDRGFYAYVQGTLLIDAFIESSIAYPMKRITLIHIASLMGDFAIVKWLLRQGANPNVTNSSCHSPLNFATAFKSTEIAKLLIQHGANVHFTDISGDSEIFHAVDYGNLEILKLLIEKKAKVDQMTNSEITPLAWAIIKLKPQEVIDCLIENGAKIDRLMPTKITCEHAAYFTQRKLGDIDLEKNIASKEFWQRSLLASLWSIAKETSFNGQQFDLEGGYGRIGINEINRLFTEFQQNYFADNESIEFIKTILNEKSIPWNADPNECLVKFLAGETLLFDSGTLGHCISVLFFGNYLVLLNREYEEGARPSVTFYQINREKAHLKAKDFKNLLRKMNIKSDDYFYQTIPILAGADLQEIQSDLINKLSITFQNDKKIGNDWIVSPKLFPYAIYLISELNKLKKETPEPTSKIGAYFYRKRQEKVINQGYSQIYKPFTSFIRLRILADYLKHVITSKENHSFEDFDHELIEMVMEKFLGKYSGRFPFLQDLDHEIRELYEKYTQLFDKKPVGKLKDHFTKLFWKYKPKWQINRRLSKYTQWSFPIKLKIKFK